MGPPRHFSGADHSFTLQAVMELQKSTGHLTEAVAGLRRSVDSQADRLQGIEDKLSGVTHKLYAAGVVLALLLAIGGFIVNKAWDFMAARLVQFEPPAAAETSGRHSPAAPQ